MFAGDGSPGLEPLPAGGEGADSGFRAVGDDQQLVEGEERGDVRLVGLELLPGAFDCGAFVGRVLEFDDAEREAVDEEDDVGAVSVVAVGDRELVDGEPVVGGGSVEVDHFDLGAADAVAVAVLDLDAPDEHAVDGAVAGFEAGAFGLGELAEGALQRVVGQVGVEVGERGAEAVFENDLGVVAFDVGAVGGVPAEVAEMLEGDLFDVGFVEGGHCGVCSGGASFGSASVGRGRVIGVQRDFFRGGGRPICRHRLEIVRSGRSGVFRLVQVSAFGFVRFCAGFCGFSWGFWRRFAGNYR